MEKLTAWLRGHVERASLRDVARRTHLGNATISRIVHGTMKERPPLETLVRLSEGLNQPLADLVEWAGDPLGLPDDDNALVVRLQAEAERDPALREILRLLRQVGPTDRRAVLTYLRGALANGQLRGQDETA